MRAGIVFRNQERVGILRQLANGTYRFSYDDAWCLDSTKPAISLGLSKQQQVHESEYLFPFFFNMLSEGVNRKLQSRQLKIDENDHFGLLLATAQYDTIGAVTIKEIEHGRE